MQYVCQQIREIELISQKVKPFLMSKIKKKKTKTRISLSL